MGEDGGTGGRRSILALFAAILAVLFVVVAVAEGLGDPGIPSGDVALVEGIPDGGGEISEARFEHALVLMSAQRREGSVPEPGAPGYDEVKEAAFDTLLDNVWTEAVAAEWGLQASSEDVAAKLRYVKAQSFSSQADFMSFRRELHLSLADVEEQLELEILNERIGKRLAAQAPRPSAGEIAVGLEEEEPVPEGAAARKAAEEQIEVRLKRELESRYVAGSTANLDATWASRTFCAAGYVTEHCANSRPYEHPPLGLAVCPEADPSGRVPPACPAPVAQSVPAMPGSVTPLEPQGEPLPQRPRPAGKG